MCACRIVVIFPTSITHAHKGPIFGIEDARTIFGFYDRPLAPIVKSRVGLDPTGTAAVAEAEVRGGLDLSRMTRQSKMSIEWEENDLCRDSLREEWDATRGSPQWPQPGSGQGPQEPG